MSQEKVNITPRTKIVELLASFPELEDVLIDLAPTFKKLKNPALRETIARVTSLQQVASVSDVPVEVIVNKLRGLVGQSEIEDVEGSGDYKGGTPSWFSADKVTKSFDARESIAAGGHPVGQVLADLQKFEADQIYELITPFLPAPLLDKVRDMGFQVWTNKENESLFKSYFIK